MPDHSSLLSETTRSGRHVNVAIIGSGFSDELDRVTDIAFEAVNATALHFRRLVGAVSSALTRAAQEVEELVWDYQDMAGDLLQSARSSSGLNNVIPIDVRRPRPDIEAIKRR